MRKPVLALVGLGLGVAAVVAVMLVVMDDGDDTRPPDAGPSADHRLPDREGIVYQERATGDLRLDVYEPAPSPTPRPAVILVHGGGWRRGDRTDLARVADLLTDEGFVAVAIDTSVTAHPGWPTQVDDVRSAIRWVREHAADLDVEPDRIGALGNSSGGHLATLAALTAAGPDERLAAVVAWSGPMDLPALVATGAPPRPDFDPTGERPPRGQPEVVAWFLGCHPQDCPGRAEDASPITHVGPGAPPVLLVSAEDDLVPVDQAESMGAALAADSVTHEVVVVEGSGHGGRVGARGIGWEATLAFLTEHLDQPS
jgi:acetyl esterase/lipase